MIDEDDDNNDDDDYNNGHTDDIEENDCLTPSFDGHGLYHYTTLP